MKRVLQAQGFVLASGSPYRRKLLESSGLVFRAVPAAGLDESRVVYRGGPVEMAVARAEAKARAVAIREQQQMVLGADQVLGVGSQSFGKVKERAQAFSRLQSLQGRQHELHSALAIALAEEGSGRVHTISSFVVSVTMRMRSLSAAQIEAYLDTNEWQGTVGCYQFENRGVHLFVGHVFDSSTIIGLPLVHLFTELRKIGLDVLTNPSGPWNCTADLPGG